MFGCCKTFSGKYIFSGNANFRKRKMFSYVWLHFKKFSGKYFLVFGKEEGKHKSENTKPQPRKKDHQRSQHKIAITARSRSEIAMAPDRDRRRAIAITGSRWRQIAIDWIFSSRDGAVDGERWDRDGAVGLELELAISDWIFSSRARALSLSLFFRKWIEVKMRGEIHFRLKGEICGQPEIIFRKIMFSVTAKHMDFPEIDFWNWFSPDSNAA